MNTLKWLGTILIILADMFRAYNLHIADMGFILMGTGIWAYTAWKQKETALLVVNLVCVILMIFGIYRSYTVI